MQARVAKLVKEIGTDTVTDAVYTLHPDHHLSLSWISKMTKTYLMNNLIEKARSKQHPSEAFFLITMSL